MIISERKVFPKIPSKQTVSLGTFSFMSVTSIFSIEPLFNARNLSFLITAVVRHFTLRSPKLLRFFGGHVLAVSTIEAVVSEQEVELKAIHNNWNED